MIVPILQIELNVISEGEQMLIHLVISNNKININKQRTLEQLDRHRDGRIRTLCLWVVRMDGSSVLLLE
jgi:hypothetical protein